MATHGAGDKGGGELSRLNLAAQEGIDALAHCRRGIQHQKHQHVDHEQVGLARPPCDPGSEAALSPPWRGRNE